MKIDLSRFLETFFQESDEHVAAMEAGLLALESAADRREALNDIFRAAHSIKGSSGTFGFEDLTRFTHALENLLDRMREGKVEPTRDRTDTLLRAVDVLRELLEAARSGGPPPDSAKLVHDLLVVAQRADFCADEPPVLRRIDKAQPAGPSAYRIRFQPSRDVFRQGMDPVLVLRSLQKLGQVLECRLDESGIPPLAELDPESCYLGWELRLASACPVEEIRDVFAFVEDGATIAIEPELAAAAVAEPAVATAAPAARAAQRETSSIRVSTAKVDRLIDLVGELVIAESMAAQILADFSIHRLAALQDAFAGMERYTRELQERVMSVRMVQVGTVFSRFPRLARDLSAATGKNIALETSGEETELDKMVVERLSDPLTHLVRNAIDHGVEPPDERAAAGKPEQATLRLRAYHQGGSVIVEVSEDGRGLDTARIRAKAIERGMIGEHEEMTEREIQALIFQPGFSTAAKVSDLSGRGVGLDVVKREVEAMNGAVAIESMPGRGTRVSIKLPLTLAILDGLLLKVGAQTYILPLVQILESIRPSRQQLNTMAGRGEVVVVRNEPIPLIRLHRLFDVATEVTEPDRGLVVLVENHGRRMAVLVDELLGQQQVVIKSLETHFRKVDGVAGATILGDGQAALILDVAGLSQMARSGVGAVARAPEGKEREHELV